MDSAVCLGSAGQVIHLAGSREIARRSSFAGRQGAWLQARDARAVDRCAEQHRDGAASTVGRRADERTPCPRSCSNASPVRGFGNDVCGLASTVQEVRLRGHTASSMSPEQAVQAFSFARWKRGLLNRASHRASCGGPKWLELKGGRHEDDRAHSKTVS